MSARESRLIAGAAPEVIAATKTMVPAGPDCLREARRTERFDRHDLRAHRAIVRELDEWFGIFKYPDPAEIYAMAPTREGEPE
jgi:hypothetical protein